jgi:hypothetical protein
MESTNAPQGASYAGSEQHSGSGLVGYGSALLPGDQLIMNTHIRRHIRPKSPHSGCRPVEQPPTAASDDHPGRIVGQPGRIVGQHGRIVGQHGRMVGQHGRMVGQHGRMVGQGGRMVGQGGRMVRGRAG